jgi:hypothetical protein
LALVRAQHCSSLTPNLFTTFLKNLDAVHHSRKL